MAPKIITRYDPPFIPGGDDSFAWSARYHDDGGAIGYGATEEEAVNELTKVFPWDGVE